MAAGSQAWRELTDFARASWNSYAGTVTRIDSLGQTVYPTGHQVFVGLYILFNDVGLASGLPSIPIESPPAAVVVIDTELDDSPYATIEIDAALTANLVLQLESSPPVSAGVSFNKDYRFLAVYDTDTAGVVNILSALEAKWGALTAGQRFFFRLTLVTLTGGPSNPTEYSLVVGV